MDHECNRYGGCAADDDCGISYTICMRLLFSWDRKQRNLLFPLDPLKRIRIFLLTDQNGAQHRGQESSIRVLEALREVTEEWQNEKVVVGFYCDLP